VTAPSDVLATAIRHHQAGELALAEPIYRQLIVLEPGNADAWHLLGVASHQQGNQQQALEYIGRALELSPLTAIYHNNQGVVYQALGNLEAAAKAFRTASDLAPNYVEAFTNAANVYREMGMLAEAKAAYQRALELNPNRGDVLFLLGNLLRVEGNFSAALAAYREAEQRQPAWLELLVNWGDTLRETGHRAEAVALLERAVAMNPNSAMALNNLGLALSESGEFDRAIPHLERAISVAPNMPEPFSNLGNIRFRQGRYADAVHDYQRAVTINPRYAQAFSNLGAALLMVGEADQAIGALTRSIELAPDNPGPYNNLATALKDQGRLDEALPLLRKSIEVDPTCAPAHSSLLYCLNYSHIDGPALLAEHRQWAAQHTSDVVPLAPPPSSRDPKRPLRIGYASPDFRRHPVAAFMEGVLRQYDRGQFQTFVYSESASVDDTTAQTRGLVTRWRDTFGWTDRELVDRVRADEIDILVELAGHTSQSRIRAFAFRPAPILVSYLGYPATTGLTEIDYRLTDAVVDPPGEPAHYSEQLWRLSPGFCCYTLVDTAPAVSALPCSGRREITFGSLHHLAKLNGEVLDLWARLLTAAPEARLLIFRDTLRGAATEHLTRELTRRGISPDRFELRWQMPMGGNHLDLYHEIDVALDAFPWSGHTTACEALGMGVPVVTLRGNRFASRMVAGVLTLAGRTEWIAETGEEYVAIAQQLVADRSQLAAIRAGLRDSLERSNLCDSAAFTRGLEAAYREMWRRYCEVREID
jgi:predicted O-linked N-acetylglucosamine transferase (SPINDLY family)